MANIQNLKSWKPGQSGNPNGRPKAAITLASYAREHGKEAIDRLINLMRNSPDDRIAGWAANALLDRGFGKPKECIEETIERPNPSPEERLAMLAEIAGRLGWDLVPRVVIEAPTADPVAVHEKEEVSAPITTSNGSSLTDEQPYVSMMIKERERKKKERVF